MKKIVYISLLFGCFIIRCNNKTSDKRKTSINTKPKEMIKVNKTSAVCPTLLNELKSLIAYNDNRDKENKYNINIYIVFFSEKVDGCYITMSTAHFYDSYYLVGYIIINNKMIAFYNPGSECNKGLIDITILKRNWFSDFHITKSLKF